MTDGDEIIDVSMCRNEIRVGLGGNGGESPRSLVRIDRPPRRSRRPKATAGAGKASPKVTC